MRTRHNRVFSTSREWFGVYCLDCGGCKRKRISRGHYEKWSNFESSKNHRYVKHISKISSAFWEILHSILQQVVAMSTWIFLVLEQLMKLSVVWRYPTWCLRRCRRNYFSSTHTHTLTRIHRRALFRNKAEKQFRTPSWLCVFCQFKVVRQKRKQTIFFPKYLRKAATYREFKSIKFERVLVQFWIF